MKALWLFFIGLNCSLALFLNTPAMADDDSDRRDGPADLVADGDTTEEQIDAEMGQEDPYASAVEHTRRPSAAHDRRAENRVIAMINNDVKSDVKGVDRVRVPAPSSLNRWRHARGSRRHRAHAHAHAHARGRHRHKHKRLA